MTLPAILPVIELPADQSGAGPGPSAPAAAQAPSAKRVIYLDHTATMGGGEIALLNLVQQLDPARYYPVVVLFQEGPLAVALRAAGIETHLLPLDPLVGSARKDALGLRSVLKVKSVMQSIRFVFRLRKLMRSLRGDICHTNSLKSDVLGGIAARLARVPVIWHIRDRITNDYLPPMVVRMFRMFARFIPNLIIANSGATLETLNLGSRKAGSVLYSGIDVRARARVVHDGTDTDATPAVRVQTAGAGPLIGLVGRISPWKGQHIFLQAAAIVRKNFPEARFQIIGAALFAEQEYEQHIRDLAKRLRVDDVVEFTGFRNDVAKVVGKLDILVHASTTGEPFGQVVIEGMAAAKPVVATNGGGIPEIVVDGVTGILVPMGDAVAMGAAIFRLLSNAPLAHRMGALGRRRALELFTIERTAGQAQSVYDEFLRYRGNAVPGDPAKAPIRRFHRVRKIGPYLFALLMSGLATAIKMLIAIPLGSHSPTFLTFYAAVLLSSWIGGIGPGLAAVLICSLATAFILPPSSSFAIDRIDQPQFILFTIVMTLTVLLIEQLHEARRQALRLQHQAESAQHRAAFLAKAAMTLSLSADYQAILVDLADIATSDLADWVTIDLISASGAIERPVAAHRDPDKFSLVQRLRAYPPRADSAHPSAKVLRSATSMISSPLDVSGTSQFAHSAEHAAITQELGCASYIVVPLMVRARTLGTVNLVRADMAHPFTQEDLNLATELASRAAMAIENAPAAPGGSGQSGGALMASAASHIERR